MHWLSERWRHCDMWGFWGYRSPQLVGECSCDTDIAAAIQDIAVLRFVCEARREGWHAGKARTNTKSQAEGNMRCSTAKHQHMHASNNTHYKFRLKWAPTGVPVEFAFCQ